MQQEQHLFIVSFTPLSSLTTGSIVYDNRYELTNYFALYLRNL